MRDEVDKALKAITVPHLRSLGFKGSYPHFYRDRDGHIDLLTFQFNKYGGSFTAEISFADRERSNVYIYKDTEPKKLRASQTTERFRLGAMPEHGKEDHWFHFEYRGVKKSYSPEEAAQEVRELIDSQAEVWWSERETQTEGANKRMESNG